MTLEDYKRTCEAHGLPLEIPPGTPYRIGWYRQAKGWPMVLTHFWLCKPEHRLVLMEAAAARHLFETHWPELPPGYEWVEFDPSSQIPYRHYPTKDIA